MKTFAPKAAWERLENESPKAFAAFCTYRDMGPDRSLEKAARAHRQDSEEDANQQGTGKKKRGGASGLFCQWSAKYRWPERAAAWDDEQERLKRKAFDAERIKMAHRQAALGQAMQRIALSALLHKTQEEVWALTAKEITALAEKGVHVERLARGEPTVTTEAKVVHSIGKDDPLKKVPLEKLEELERMLASVLEPQEQDGSCARAAEQADASDASE